MSETLVSGYYGKEIARWKPLTIITKRSILDVAAALDPPLKREMQKQNINWREINRKSNNRMLMMSRLSHVAVNFKDSFGCFV